MKCTSCGSTEIVLEGSSYACSECGNVLEESNIVSEVSFVEGTNGTSSVVGQFVSSTTGRSNFRGRGLGFGRESREVTIENGKKRLQTLASQLNLSSFHVDAAQRLFMLAIQHNFIQGRKTINVCAACLYLICRREKTPHMLIDFSDVLQVLIFLLFIEKNLKDYCIDKCIYIRTYFPPIL